MKKYLFLLVIIIILLPVSGRVFSSHKKYNEIVVVTCSENLDKSSIEEMFSDNVSISVPAGESFFILDFNGEIALEKIDVKMTGSGEISIKNTDYSGKQNYGEVTEGKRYFGNQALECSELKISLKSDEEFIISAVKIYGKSNVEEYLYTENEILLDEFDVRNPVSVYRSPICKYVELLANDILKEAGSDITDHEKIMCFMDYISDYKIGVTKSDGGDYLQNLIIRKIGSCGDYSNLLAALCTTQGLESRLYTLGNYPEGSGHAVVEIKMDGKWSVYDPTYALYYTTTPENSKNPEVLSFEDLRAGHGRDATKIMASENHIFDVVSYEYMGPEIYELANPAGEVSPLHKLYYPMYVEFSGDMEINPSTYQGGNYLGIGSIGNAHVWTIAGLQKGEKYRITIEAEGGIWGEITEPFETFAEVKNSSIDKNSCMKWHGEENEKWEIELTACDKEIELTLDYSENWDKYHYIMLKSVVIEKIK